MHYDGQHGLPANPTSTSAIPGGQNNARVQGSDIRY